MPHWGELGVALLLFSIGLEFSFGRLKRLGSAPCWAGVLQVTVTLALFALIFSFRNATGAAVAWGQMVAVSSTAIVLRILMDRAEMDSVSGRAALGILLLQDIAVVPLVLALTVMSHGGSAGDVALQIGKTIAAAGGMVVVFYGLFYHLIPRLLMRRGLFADRELVVLLAIILAFGSAWAAHSLGLSPALGAFLAGMLLAESPFCFSDPRGCRLPAHAVRDLVFHLRGNAGRPDVVPGQLEGGARLARGGLCRQDPHHFRHRRGAQNEPGLRAGHRDHPGPDRRVLFRAGNRGQERRIDRRPCFLPGRVGDDPLHVPGPLHGHLCAAGRPAGSSAVFAARPPGGAAGRRPSLLHRQGVFIVGFGPAGRKVARALLEKGIRPHVIELNPGSVKAALRMGLTVHLGDASHAEIITHAGIHGACVIVVTVPDPRSAKRILQNIHALSPGSSVIVRSRYNIATRESLGIGGGLCGGRGKRGRAGARAAGDRLLEGVRSGNRHLRAAAGCGVRRW